MYALSKVKLSLGDLLPQSGDQGSLVPERAMTYKKRCLTFI